MFFFLLVAFSFVLFFFFYRVIQFKVNHTDEKVFIRKNNLYKPSLIKKNGIGLLDHIYILNLKKNEKKKEVIKKEIEIKFNRKLNADNFFPAFYGKTVKNSVSSLVAEGFLHPAYKLSFLDKIFHGDSLKNPGQLGHYLSFYGVFKNAMANDLEFFMIVEDDAVFVDNFVESIDPLVRFLQKNNYAYASLGQADYFYQKNKKLLKSSDFVFKEGGSHFFPVDLSLSLFRQTHAMIFRTDALKFIMPDYFPMTCPTDVALGNWARHFSFDITNEKTFLKRTSLSQQKIKGLFCFPPLSWQNETHKSDIDHWTAIDFKKIKMKNNK